MADTIVAWDTDELGTHTTSMELKKKQLDGQKKFLEGINANVQTAWKGIAGASFDERMDVDIDNYKSIVEDVDLLITDLKKAAERYGACESSILTEINSLRGKIHY